MPDKAQIKHIQSLADKKYRQEHKQFVIEGLKMVNEAIRNMNTTFPVYATKDIVKHLKGDIEPEIVQDWQLAKMTQSKNPQGILAVLPIPETEYTEPFSCHLALEKIQDPGNLGTIIRIADWFGIDTIYCSPDCVDVYNHKVLQASMGSFLRVRVIYKNLTGVLEKTKLKKYAAVLDGQDIRSFEKVNQGILVIGNESKGISDELLRFMDHKVQIEGKGGAESLNASIACGILCHQLFS